VTHLVSSGCDVSAAMYLWLSDLDIVAEGGK
jgi:hypothetical protein